jgi:hypothetical protein
MIPLSEFSASETLATIVKLKKWSLSIQEIVQMVEKVQGVQGV